VKRKPDKRETYFSAGVEQAYYFVIGGKEAKRSEFNPLLKHYQYDVVRVGLAEKDKLRILGYQIDDIQAKIGYLEKYYVEQMYLAERFQKRQKPVPGNKYFFRGMHPLASTKVFENELTKLRGELRKLWNEKREMLQEFKGRPKGTYEFSPAEARTPLPPVSSIISLPVWKVKEPARAEAEGAKGRRAGQKTG
jgi:hypothetical protein